MNNPDYKSNYTWIGPLSLGLVFFSMCMLYWRKWGDIIIDYGREVYIPWQLLSGKVLYRDIDYAMGPIGPYLNALWFKISGISITTLFVFNLIIIAILTYIIYQVINKLCDQTTSTLSGLVFLVFFAFSPASIHNFISPYDHNLTYGFFCAVLMIYLLFSYQYQPKLIKIIGAGFCLGLAFLTKAEIFSAAIMTAIIAITITHKVLKLKEPDFYSIIILFIGAMMLPILLFFTYFSFQMPLDQALRAVTGNWYVIFNSEMAKAPWYRFVSGLDHPLKNISIMIASFFLVLVMLLVAVVIEFIRSGVLKNLKFVILAGGLALVLVVILLRFIDINQVKGFIKISIGRSLPLLSIFMIALSIIFLIRCDSKEDKITSAQIIVWFIFGFFLLTKIIFRSTILIYGFVLAVPSILSLVILIIWLVPRLLTVFWGNCYLFRKMAISCVIILLIGGSILNYNNYANKTQLVGKGFDSFYICDNPKYIYDNPGFEGSAVMFNQMVQYIETSIPAQATILVLPEGAMINYLTRHRASIPLVFFTLTDIIAFGEPYIINSLTKNPPDFIVLITYTWDAVFGSDFGIKMVDWVTKHYTTVFKLGGNPLKKDKIGMQLLKSNLHPRPAQP